MDNEIPMALRRKRRHCTTHVSYAQQQDSEDEDVQVILSEDSRHPKKKRNPDLIDLEDLDLPPRQTSQLLPDKGWKQVFNQLSNIKDLMSAFAVCQQFRRVASMCFPKQMLIAVGKPFPLDSTLAKAVVPYHQKFGSKPCKQSSLQVKKIRWTDSNLLQVSNFVCLFENPSSFLQNVSTLRLVSSQTVRRVQTVNLICLRSLQALEVCGFGIDLVNPAQVQLDRLLRLELDDTVLPDLLKTCPNLQALKCPAPLFCHVLNTEKQSDDSHLSNIVKNLQKLYLIDDLSPELILVLAKLTSLQKLSLECEFLFVPRIFEKAIPSMKNLRRLNVFAINEESGLDIEFNDRDRLENIFTTDIQLYPDLSFCYNGFLVTKDTSWKDLKSFCKRQFWNGNQLANVKFDRYKADKARTRLLKVLRVKEDDYMDEAEKMLEFALVENFHLSASVEQYFFTSMVSKWTNLRHLTLNHQINYDDRNYQYDLEFLTRIPLLQNLQILGMHVRSWASLAKAVRNLSHLTTVQLHFVRMTAKIYDQLQQAFVAKAQQNPNLQFTLVMQQQKGKAKPSALPENFNLVFCSD